ncbi:MAG TPA: hypothetical protein VEY71_08480, partial [Chitinophagales bacterium]|nr:hypothetical protein [Chitinophagales bacterium]
MRNPTGLAFTPLFTNPLFLSFQFMMHILLFVLSVLPLIASAQPATVFSTTGGAVSFVSEAPLETIRASSNEVKGLINTADNTFAFSVPNRTFHGFNSALQEEHFN